VLVPVVENAISGDAMRPGDVLASRKGLTDRGRQHRRGGPADPGRRPDPGRRAGAGLTIDLATLTGAARIALGPQLPPFYTDDDDLARRSRRARARPRPGVAHAAVEWLSPRRWTATSPT
jgi:leucyl aminopeptidase